MINRSLTIVLALLAWLGLMPLRTLAATPPAGPTWLGVEVGPVPPILRTQLPETIGPDEGLLVMRVIPGSPADKGGVQPHDVLVAFNGQRLHHPKELIQQVRGARAGDQARLELARHGKLETLTVTLEARRPPAQAQRPALQGPRPQGQVRSWESFQSLSVTKNADGNYVAVVEFLDDQGHTQRFEYQGSRDEISAQVKKEQGLPDGLKQQLLDALSDRGPALPLDFPPFPQLPDFRELERELFAPPPWFRQGPRPGYWN